LNQWCALVRRVLCPSTAASTCPAFHLKSSECARSSHAFLALRKLPAHQHKLSAEHGLSSDACRLLGDLAARIDTSALCAYDLLRAYLLAHTVQRVDFDVLCRDGADTRQQLMAEVGAFGCEQ
jgi:hypothetical protein